MKKYLSVLFIAIFALALTGCGKGNTLKCTLNEDGHKGSIEVTFKGDKVSKVVAKEEMASKEEAESYVALYTAFVGSEEGMTAKADGKYFVVTMSGKAVDDSEYKGLTKADVKKSAEEEGYKCK